jgi:4-hydroxy-tetrahydrodipicolinate synthase
MFKGSYVALVTPMFEDGSIDFESLKNLVEFHITNGTHGIVSVGTTGESATLPFEEHILVIKKTIEYAAGRIKIIAGSGANSTSEAIELSQEIAKSDIDGFLSVVPYYNKPQQRGMIAHFEAIADATPLPVLLYNVPGRTVADMQSSTVAELAKHDRIVGIKDATGDLSRFTETKALVPEDFVILSGDDATGCEFLCLGGDGVISVTANIVPKQMAQMTEAAASGEFEVARSLDKEISSLHDLLFIEPNPVMPKWALYKMNMMKDSFLRLPMVQAELNNKNAIEEALQALKIIS